VLRHPEFGARNQAAEVLIPGPGFTQQRLICSVGLITDR